MFFHFCFFFASLVFASQNIPILFTIKNRKFLIKMIKSKITKLLASESMESNVNLVANNEQTTERIRTCRVCKKQFLLKDLLKVLFVVIVNCLINSE